MTRVWVLVSLLALAGCDERERHDTPAPDSSASTAAEAGDAWIPDEGECRVCHDDVAESWSSSRHHASFTNADFQRSWAREPLEFCRDCHAPERARADGEATGVGCVSCHLDGETLISGPAREQKPAPHPLVRDPEFATSVCARCHEFAFPASSGRAPGAMMQTTMSEHRRSDHADRACGDCHMPRAQAIADHSLASSRNPQAIRDALAVTATRRGDTLVLELRPRNVGHAFPTGDLFRRLAVHAELRDADGQVLASALEYREREFLPRFMADGHINALALEPEIDRRLTGPTTLELTPTPAVTGSSALHWWIDYERVDDRNPHAPERSTIASSVRLAAGEL